VYYPDDFWVSFGAQIIIANLFEYFRSVELKKTRICNKRPLQSQVRGTGGVLALSLLISGCAVGPNFNAPAAPVNSDQYSYTGKAKVTETVKANTFAGQSQKLSSGQDIPAAWWEVFTLRPWIS